MNQEIKQRWVAALRSGQYKQGRYMLRSKDDCFCCLGVLCDLMVQDGKAEWVTEKKVGDRTMKTVDVTCGDGYFCSVGGDATSGMPPESLRKLVEINDGHIRLTDPDGESSPVTLLNDEREFSFTALADLIEQQL